MNRPAYITEAIIAIANLENSILHASRLLPEALRRQHWQAEHRGEPSPWRNVSQWYWTQEDTDPDMVKLLEHLVLLSEARACLKNVLTPRPTHAPDVSLPKTRRPGVR